MLPWSFSEERATEKYMAQLQHNMWVVASRTAVLSVINGGGKWVERRAGGAYNPAPRGHARFRCPPFGRFRRSRRAKQECDATSIHRTGYVAGMPFGRLPGTHRA